MVDNLHTNLMERPAIKALDLVRHVAAISSNDEYTQKQTLHMYSNFVYSVFTFTFIFHHVSTCIEGIYFHVFFFHNNKRESNA